MRSWSWGVRCLTASFRVILLSGDTRTSVTLFYCFQKNYTDYKCLVSVSVLKRAICRIYFLILPNNCIVQSEHLYILTHIIYFTVDEPQISLRMLFILPNHHRASKYEVKWSIFYYSQWNSYNGVDAIGYILFINVRCSLKDGRHVTACLILKSTNETSE